MYDFKMFACECCGFNIDSNKQNLWNPVKPETLLINGSKLLCNIRSHMNMFVTTDVPLTSRHQYVTRCSMIYKQEPEENMQKVADSLQPLHIIEIWNR